MKMPEINIASLTGENRDYALAITVKGCLRASKPKGGRQAYVWRMVAFTISPNPRHHCMPCTADFGIQLYDSSGRWDVAAVRRECERLDVIVDAIVNTVRPFDWHGVHRWGNALGLIGEPQYADDGSVIYR